MVRTVDTREAAEINAQKKSIVGISNIAELGAVRMEETLGKATLRDAAIGTGIAVDKMLALTGQAAMVAVRANLPSPVKRARSTQRTLSWTKSPAGWRRQRTSLPASAARFL